MKAVQCDAPSHPKNGRVVYTSRNFNSLASYECNYEFRLEGPKTRHCGADKTWSGEEPVCKGKYYEIYIFIY